MTTQTWGVTQRYIYSPYGSMIVLNSDFRTPPAGTQPISDYLYQGMTLDAVTGLYYARNRNYSPSLGVWISQDPLQYVNGANTYQMEMSGPVGESDPAGLWSLSGVWGDVTGAILHGTGVAISAVGRFIGNTGGGTSVGYMGAGGNIDTSGMNHAMGQALQTAGNGLQAAGLLNEGNQQFMNALSPSDQPMPAVAALRQFLNQAKTGSPKECEGSPQDKQQDAVADARLKQLLMAAQAEAAANAQAAAALTNTTANLQQSIGDSVNVLVGAAAGFATGFAGDALFARAGLSDVFTISPSARVVGAGFNLAYRGGAGLLGSALSSQFLTGVWSFPGAELLSGTGDALTGAGIDIELMGD